MLKYKLENLDGLEESLKSLYVEKDGGFILEIDENPAKKAIEKEREISKSLNEKLTAIETAKLKEQGNFKELLVAKTKELDELKADSILKSKEILKNSIVSKFASATDTERKVIARFADDYISVDGVDVKLTKDMTDVEKELSVFTAAKIDTIDVNIKPSSGESAELSKMTPEQAATAVAEGE